MGKTYVTFGQDHVHSVNGKTFDKDTVAVIEAENSYEGRQKAFYYFGPKFCFEYYEKQWNEESIRWFPKGYVNVEE